MAGPPRSARTGWPREAGSRVWDRRRGSRSLAGAALAAAYRGLGGGRADAAGDAPRLPGGLYGVDGLPGVVVGSVGQPTDQGMDLPPA